VAENKYHCGVTTEVVRNKFFMFNPKKLLKSFYFAFRGVFRLLRAEQNMRVHLLASVVVLFLSAYLRIELWQWIVMIMLITMVFILEILNTVFERFTDMLKPRVHGYVAEIKDMMSAAVLISAISSIIVGLLILVPYLLRLS